MAELRQEYANDPEALEQIDIYDGNSPYNAKIREYVDALKFEDTQKQTKLESWFKQNYPHTSDGNKQ